MNKKRGFITMRGAFISAICMVAAALTACSSFGDLSPADYAIRAGNPDPLANLIFSGKVQHNDMIPTSGGSVTPLCAIASSRRQAAAVDMLLAAGADINKPCIAADYKSKIFTAEELVHYPMDILLQQAVAWGTEKDAWNRGSGVNYDNVQFVMKRIEEFAARGAISTKGRLTYRQLQELVAKDTGTMNFFIEEDKRRVAAEKKDSLFSAENLGAVVAIAGGAVNNYAASQGLNQPNQLPLAALSAATSTSNSRANLTLQASAANQQRTTSTPAATQAVPDVVEPNRYEKWPNSPSSWGNSPGWDNSRGSGDSRSTACSIATEAQREYIGYHESRGYLQLAERTGCICGTVSRMANATLPRPQWMCVAYHQLRDTGKRRPDASK